MEPQGQSVSWSALEPFSNNQSCRFANILLHLLKLQVGVQAAKTPKIGQELVKMTESVYYLQTGVE